MKLHTLLLQDSVLLIVVIKKETQCAEYYEARELIRDM